MQPVRRVLTGALTIAALAAVPAAAQAKTAVLQVDRARHALRTVDTTTQKVRSVHYRGRLARSVRPGALIRSKKASGVALRDVRRIGSVRSVEVPGTILATGAAGATVALSDGRPLNVSLTLVGLQPGQAVTVALHFDTTGGVAITITLAGASDPGDDDDTGDDDDPSDGEDHPGEEQPAPDCVQDGVRGRIVGLNRTRNSISIVRPWGDEETYPATAAVLNGLTEQSVVLLHLAGGSVDVATPLPAPGTVEFDGTVVRISDDAQ